MNKIILQLVLLGFCIAIGQALQCYNCNLGLWGFCIGSSEIKCEAGEHCFSGVGKAGSLVNIRQSGCLEEAKCNQTSEVNFPESSTFSVYSMVKTCCNTDRCNSGAPGLPGASRLSLGLAAVTALLMAQVLV